MASSNILNVTEKPMFDELITQFEYRNYVPYNSNFNHSEDITISLNHSDLFILPSESYLLVEIKIKKSDGKAAVAGDFQLTNNAIPFLFEEARLDLCGTTIDRTRGLGFTTTIMNYLTATPGQKNVMENAGFKQNATNLGESTYHSYSIPLRLLFGKAHDYKKIIVNSKIDLILSRARSDTNAYIKLKEVDYSIDIAKIAWRVPHIIMNDLTRLSFMKLVDSGKYISLPFRSWDYVEHPNLPESSHVVWSAKTSNGIEKPRYIIIGLQTAKKNVKNANPSLFDHCNLTNIKVYLNSIVLPYEDLNLNFGEDKFNVLYDMYLRFQKSFYGKDHSNVILSREDFKSKAPLIVIDCSNQPESIKMGTIDLKIDMQFKENIAANTSCHCVILYDRIFEYCPIKSDVRRIL